MNKRQTNRIFNKTEETFYYNPRSNNIMCYLISVLPSDLLIIHIQLADFNSTVWGIHVISWIMYQQHKRYCFTIPTVLWNYLQTLCKMSKQQISTIYQCQTLPLIKWVQHISQFPVSELKSGTCGLYVSTFSDFRKFQFFFFFFTLVLVCLAASGKEEISGNGPSVCPVYCWFHSVWYFSSPPFAGTTSGLEPAVSE